jgi:ribosomal protein S18 acetylase RimI-like enzyme
MTTPVFEVADHAVRRLGRGDARAIHQLFEACSEFFRLIHMDPTAEAEAIFDEVPPNKRPDDKLVFGLFRHDQLVGVVELLRDYPAQDDWCLGLLIVLPAHRGEGLGAAAVAATTRFVSQSGGRTLQLIVQEQNPGALRFWQRHGFVIQDHVTQKTASGTNQVARLVRALHED